MSVYEFKLEMEFSGYNTDRPELVEKFYKIYLDELQKQISNNIIPIKVGVENKQRTQLRRLKKQ